MLLTAPELAGLAVLGLGAGMLGALVGIGGGVVIVPALIILFGFDVRVAVATSLLSVIATSVAAGSVHLGEGLANLRIGLSLEIATTLGGIAGGLTATWISPRILSALLGVVLGVTAALLLKGREPRQSDDDEPDSGQDQAPTEASEAVGRLAGTFHDGHTDQLISYQAERVPQGSAVAFGAGTLSGMLGVGGGFLKVPAMNLVMGIPLKVSAATSNFMVGVTALASLFIYIARGYLYPYVAAPVALGVVLGALSGTRLQHRSSPRLIRWVLSLVLVGIAVELIVRAIGGLA